MTTQPTNLPIPSENPRDLKFNSGCFDKVINSNENYYIDRFGVRRFTIAGFQYTAEEAIRNYGYITMDSFEDGAALTLPNQVLRYEATGEYYRFDGELPKTVPAGSTPETSGGVGLGAWVGVGDASLRSNLASHNPPGASLVALANGTVNDTVKHTTPQAFGAIGDGVADDTIPLQNAMDYCQINNIKLVIPSGRYRITKPLLYRNQGFYNYEIEGHGGAAVIIMDSLEKTGITEPDAFGVDVNVNAAIVVLTDTNQSKFCRISGIRFTTTVNADYGIYLSATENSLIQDCFFEGYKFGVYDKGSWVQRVARCIARNCTDTGFFIEQGTSTYIQECYVDFAMRGYYLGGGYSSIQNCACDHTTRWSYFFQGGPTGADLATVSMFGCGSENSGTDAAIYCAGLVALSVEDYNAGNFDTIQPYNTGALLSMSSVTSYSQVVMKNVRAVGFDYLIVDNKADHNFFDLTNVTCSSPLSAKYSLGSNSRVLERTYDGERFITRNDLVGIGFAESDIVDGWTDLTLSGLRNGQFIIRRTVSIPRTSGDAGFAVINLPFNMNTNYAVVANLDADFGILQSVCPTYSVTEKTTSYFKLCASSAKNNTTWSAIDVDVIIYGLKT